MPGHYGASGLLPQFMQQQPGMQPQPQPQADPGGLLAQFQMPTAQLAQQRTMLPRQALQQIDPKKMKQRGQPGWLAAILSKLQPMMGQLGQQMLQRPGGLGGLGGFR